MIDPFVTSAVVIALVIGLVVGFNVRAVLFWPGYVVQWRPHRWWFVWFPLVAFVVVAGVASLGWFVHDVAVSIGWFVWYFWRRVVALWLWL